MENIEELYIEAEKAVRHQEYASTSLLQRRLLINYITASKLIDMLWERGVIGDMDGAKPRELLSNPVK